MKSYASLRMHLVHERQMRDIREARQYRLARQVDRRARRRPVRHAVGRSLVRLGQRLAADSDRSLEPARSL